MSTQIQITPKSGITIGSTEITSGTDNRVLFQSSGKVSQSANFTFNSTLRRLQINATTGAGGNDVPLLIRNSADNLDLLRFRANGDHSLGSEGGISLSLNAKSGYSYTTLNLNGQGNTERAALRQTSNRLTFTHTNSDTVSATLTTSGLSVGFGDIGASARLDIKAQGALSTDLAFRVRNSADTQNSFQIDGLGQGKIKSTSYVPKFSVSYDWAGSERNAFVFTQNIQNFRGQEWTFDAGYNGNAERLVVSNDLTGNEQGYFSICQNNFNFGKTWHPAETSSERRVLRIYNGVSPSARTASETDFFKMYSADIVAGNASPHFQTENGDVIKLYKQSSTGIATVLDIVTVLTNLGLLG